MLGIVERVPGEDKKNFVIIMIAQKYQQAKVQQVRQGGLHHSSIEFGSAERFSVNCQFVAVELQKHKRSFQISLKIDFGGL